MLLNILNLFDLSAGGLVSMATTCSTSFPPNKLDSAKEGVMNHSWDGMKMVNNPK